MRWYKIILFIGVLLSLAYTASMYFVEDSKEMIVEKEINYPVETLYPQFVNLQKFSNWNDYFSKDKDLVYQFYIPYDGLGSSMSFQDVKNQDKSGELYIRYANPLKTIRYQLFLKGNEMPFLIDVKLVRISATKTKTIWKIHTPKQPFLKRSLNLFAENFTEENIAQSLNNLSAMMSNKVVKDQQMANIKQDTIMLEKIPAQILLGVSVNTSNKKDNLLKNIIQNHNKVNNFIKMDLGKKEDEFGLPMLIMDPTELKNKEISYFYGFPISQKVGIRDNSLIFRTMNETQALVYYYKGSFEGRIKPIQLLLQKAKKDTMRNGEIIESFLQEPQENKDCFLKISLPIYR
jgi:hypothetical protein